MKHPDIGMHFSDVHKRLRRLNKAEQSGKIKDIRRKQGMEKSLLNQARLHEGDGAVKELHKEFYESHAGNRVAYNPNYSKGWDRIFGRKEES